jgi:hypothetical protein
MIAKKISDTCLIIVVIEQESKKEESSHTSSIGATYAGKDLTQLNNFEK